MVSPSVMRLAPAGDYDVLAPSVLTRLDCVDGRGAYMGRGRTKVHSGPMPGRWHATRTTARAGSTS